MRRSRAVRYHAFVEQITESLQERKTTDSAHDESSLPLLMFCEQTGRQTVIAQSKELDTSLAGVFRTVWEVLQEQP